MCSCGRVRFGEEKMRYFFHFYLALVAAWIAIDTAAATEARLMLLANRKDIRAVDLDRNLTRVVVDKTNEAVALSFIHSTGTLFWVEVGSKLIMKAPMPPIYTSYFAPTPVNTHEIIVQGNIGQVDGIACDWLSMKIYWTDATLRRIEVADVNGKYRKVLIWANMELPRSIAVVANRGLMFWTDWGEKPKIERSSMDGTERSVILNEGLGWPNGLSIDPDEPRLFFSDAKWSNLFSVDFYGKNKVAVQKYEGHPYSVVVLDNYVYWTDWQNSSIYIAPKNGMGTMRKALLDSHLTTLDIKFYSSNQQSSNITTPCNDNNGGCSDLCLLSSKYPGMSCACPTGVRLRQDGKTCQPDISSMFIVARKVDIQSFSLDTPDYTLMALPLQGIKHAVAVDFDAVEGFVYWSDDQTKSISRARLNGTDQQMIIGKDIFIPDGIAVDWIARNIYFTDAQAGRIHVALLDGKHRKTIISTGLKKPRGIAVDSKGGRVYWTDWGVGVVERAHLDGSNRETLVRSPQSWPNGIALDLERGKMYWGDGKSGQLEEANLDGTNRIILIDKISHIFGLTLFEGYLYWSEWKLSRLERYKIENGERDVLASNVADIMLVWAGSIKKPIAIPDNPCLNGGGCSHLCLNTPKGRTCACPDGMTPTEDGNSCESEKPELLVMSPDGKFLLATVNSNNTLVNNLSNEISEVQAVGPIDYYWQDKSLFFFDSIRRIIYRTYLERPGRVEAVVKHGLERVTGIGVDWLAGNLYWTDYHQERLEVSRLNGAHRRVLLWESIRPSTLIVDSIGRQLFWVDTAITPRIERSRLDGSRRSKLVEIKDTAQAMALDPIDKKLYWTDGEGIESVDLNGKSKRSLPWNAKFTINDLAVHGSRLFISNGSFLYTSAVARTDQISNLWECPGSRGISTVKVMERPSPIAWNQCALANGDCPALCFAAPIKDKDHYCSCGTHYTLDKDGKCVLPRHMLLFAKKSQISRILLGTDSPDIVLPIPARLVRYLNFDPYTGHIYWLESLQEQVYRSKDDGSEYGPAFKPPNNESRITEFAMDPLTAQIFWICGNRNTINVARMMPQGNFKQLGVIAAVERPRNIAVHYQKYLVVFLNHLGQSYNVMSCGYDGSNLRTVFAGKDKIRMPLDLVVDTETDTIFWSDSAARRIDSVNLDGEGYNIVSKEVEANALAIYEEKLVVLSRKAQKIYMFNKVTGQEVVSIVIRRSHLYDIYTLSPSLPLHRPKECPCSHICLVHGQKDVKFSCSCPAHFAEGSCDLAMCSSTEFTCKSGAIHCINMEGRCDGRNDCTDRSDEIGCCNPALKNFKCASNSSVCISQKRVCDGQMNCFDGSDEKDCEIDCQEENCCRGKFRCQKTPGKHACMSSDRICNNEDECIDRIDELSCCEAGMFQCHDTRDCLEVSKVCDGVIDCADNSDEYSCCSDNCRSATPGATDIQIPTGESSNVRLIMVLLACFVCLAIFVGLICAKREPKLPYEGTMQYQARTQMVSSPVMPVPLIRGPPTAPSSATSSDPTTYPNNPPPSPATVQSYEYYLQTNSSRPLPMRSAPPSTCSSSQMYMGSEVSFLAGHHRTRVGGGGFVNVYPRPQRPNTPCSTDACDEFDALYSGDNIAGTVPPPGSPVPTEKSLLYTETV